METWQVTIAVLGVILGPAGAAWVGVRTSVNGMREDVRETRKKVEEHGNRLTRIETKLEDLEGR